MYSIGGCSTMPGSCRSGLRSRPSMAGGSWRSKGFDVNSMNARNPVLTTPITPSTRAVISSGRWPLKTLTAVIHTPSISVQRRSDPSWPPHTPAPPAAPPRSRRRCLSPRRRSAAPLVSAPPRAPAPARPVRALESWHLDRFLRLRTLLQRVRRLRRHVVLVVLRQHLARGEHAVRAELPLRHDPFAFAEQIRQLAAVDHRHRLRRVGDDEAHFHPCALHAPRHHHAADAESAPHRRLVRRHLRRREEEHQVLVERRQHQGRGDAERHHAERDPRHALMPWFHASSSLPNRPQSPKGRRSRRRRPRRRTRSRPSQKIRSPLLPPDKGVGKNMSAHCVSTISQRKRTIATAMLYIQNASAIRIIPVNMVAAMLGALVKLTDAPWCSVFHHFTE